MRYFVIGDIHGEYEKFQHLIHLMIREGNFEWGKDTLVQLGDKNDRGPDTYKVFEALRQAKHDYPDRVVCIYGNHEDLMVRAAKDYERNYHLFQLNGGNKTERSYSDVTKLYGRSKFSESLLKTGHWKFLTEQHDTFFEDDEDKVFFCHAPIPLRRIRGMSMDQGEHEPRPFRQDLRTLIWSYHGEDIHNWVDPDPAEGKTCVYGHIHGLYESKETGEVVAPGVRTIGNCYLIDTGCGCHRDAYLTALELPAKRVYTSRGEVYDIN